MFVSYNWLRELTDTKLSPEEIRERLTNVGLAVDAVETRSDDFVLDVEVPSNRGDCLSHIGIARELGVIEKSKVQSPESQVQRPKSKVQSPSGQTSDFTSVQIVEPMQAVGFEGHAEVDRLVGGDTARRAARAVDYGEPTLDTAIGIGLGSRSSRLISL